MYNVQPISPPAITHSRMSKKPFSGIVADTYQISRKLTSGTYGKLSNIFSGLIHPKQTTGDIYTAFNIHNCEAVALKFESSSHPSHVLENEYQIYKSLGSDIIGLPEVKYFGTEKQGKVMIMQLLGSSLEKLFLSCSRKFSQTTIILLALQLVSQYS